MGWELPDGWRLLAQPIARSAELDEALEIHRDDASDDIEYWVELEEVISGRRVLLRMVQEVRNRALVPAGVRIASVVLLPSDSNGRVSAADLRFPLRSIEDAAVRQQLPGLTQLRSRESDRGWSPPSPVGSPDGTEGYYGRVAQLWLHFRDDPYPTARVAEVNGVSLPTAQRWVKEARTRGWLPAVRRGRAK